MDRQKMGGIAFLLLRELILKKGKDDKNVRRLTERINQINVTHDEFFSLMAKLFKEIVDRTFLGEWINVTIKRPISEEALGEIAIKLAKDIIRRKSVSLSGDPTRDLLIPSGVSREEARECVCAIMREMIDEMAAGKTPAKK